MSSSIAFSIFTELHNHCHHPTSEDSYRSKKKLCVHQRSPRSCFRPSPPQPPIYFLLLWIYLFRVFHRNGIIKYVWFFFFLFGDWLLLLNIIFSRFIHIMICISTSFFLVGKSYSVAWMYHTLGLFPLFGSFE